MAAAGAGDIQRARSKASPIAGRRRLRRLAHLDGWCRRLLAERAVIHAERIPRREIRSQPVRRLPSSLRRRVQAVLFRSQAGWYQPTVTLSCAIFLGWLG
jgi:hypothetical protein